MNFHEYQAKQLFADYGIAVPAGRVARTPDEAVDAAKAIGGDFWVVKAQIHAGGRGKAGGVKLAKTLEDVRKYAEGMLGTKMATYQTAGVELAAERAARSSARSDLPRHALGLEVTGDGDLGIAGGFACEVDQLLLEVHDDPS